MTFKTFASTVAETVTTAGNEVPPEGNQSLVILITGLVVVFSALLLLIAIIKIYSGIVRATQGKGKNKAQKAPKEKKASSVKTTNVASVGASNTVDLQTIAVISAAVEAFYDEEKVRVVSVKPTANPVKRAPVARSEWAVAGMMQNISSRRGF